VDSLYERSLRVGAFGLNVDRDRALWAELRAELSSLASNGQLALNVESVLPLESAADVHRALEARQTTGKRCLRVNP
jgi:NADPH:quinone reductase